MSAERTIIMCPSRLTCYEDAEDFHKRIALHEPREGNIVLDGSTISQWSAAGSNYLIGLLVDMLRRRGVLLVNWPDDAAVHTRGAWGFQRGLILDRVFLPDDPKAIKEIDFTGKTLPPPARSRRNGEKGGVQ